MNNKERVAMQQALDALENERCHVSANWDNIVKAITALREALEQPVSQEPVAWYEREDSTNIYTAPQPVKEVELTDDEIAKACGWEFGQPMYEWVIGLARAVIAADRRARGEK